MLKGPVTRSEPGRRRGRLVPAPQGRRRLFEEEAPQWMPERITLAVGQPPDPRPRTCGLPGPRVPRDSSATAPTARGWNQPNSKKSDGTEAHRARGALPSDRRGGRCRTVSMPRPSENAARGAARPGAGIMPHGTLAPWSLEVANRKPVADILAATQAGGYDMGGVVRNASTRRQDPHRPRRKHISTVVIVGARGLRHLVAASRKARKPPRSAIIEPSPTSTTTKRLDHGGRGTFGAPKNPPKTMRKPDPSGVPGSIRRRAFEPKDNAVTSTVPRGKYRRLIVARV